MMTTKEIPTETTQKKKKVSDKQTKQKTKKTQGKTAREKRDK